MTIALRENRYLRQEGIVRASLGQLQTEVAPESRTGNLSTLREKDPR